MNPNCKGCGRSGNECVGCEDGEGKAPERIRAFTEDMDEAQQAQFFEQVLEAEGLPPRP